MITEPAGSAPTSPRSPSAGVAASAPKSPTNLGGADGTACAPNISAAGRRMRRRFGLISMAVTVVGLVACLALRLPWYLRTLLAIPGALAAIGLLQARRGTCVARAAEDTFEHDDFSKTPVSADDARRSRRAAARVTRDTVLIALLCAAGAAASALLR
ncbi:MAG: hypothetical protein ABI560_10980 [Myxococcales bacterium]